MAHKYFGQNEKMKKTTKANPGTKFINFNLPALKTCPQRGACEEFCYANQGRYVFSNVKETLDWRYEATKKEDFVEKICSALKHEAHNKDLQLYVRLHDSGDFYDEKYLDKWVQIMRKNPSIQFYAYTKCISMFKQYNYEHTFPDNFTYIFSHGGKEDHLINPFEKQAKIFGPNDKMEDPWVDATDNDMIAIVETHIGLPYHGTKKWSQDK